MAEAVKHESLFPSDHYNGYFIPLWVLIKVICHPIPPIGYNIWAAFDLIHGKYPFISHLYPKRCKITNYSYFCTLKGITMSLAGFVKEKRKAVRLTQPELASKAGVGLRFVRELEQGKESLRLDKVNQVLQLFGYEVGAVVRKMNTPL